MYVYMCAYKVLVEEFCRGRVALAGDAHSLVDNPRCSPKQQLNFLGILHVFPPVCVVFVVCLGKRAG